jgi:2-oxoglutarate ferredoxin oxidoreductase subunit alpha
MVMEAARIATKFMTPVFFLSDGYLANGAEPWRIPKAADLADFPVHMHTDRETYTPYARNEWNARPWAVPGTPGLEHRIGGLEKENITGNINYSPENHEFMVRLRAKKIAGIADDIPELEIFGDQDGGDLLVLGWGSTYGAIRAAVEKKRAQGVSVSQAHLRYLNPLPRNTAEVLRKFKHVAIPEMNTGQLVKIIRSEFLIDAKGWNKIQGLPFFAAEIEARIDQTLAPQN